MLFKFCSILHISKAGRVIKNTFMFRYVTGKNLFFFVFFTLIFASYCFCSLKGYYPCIMVCLREPCPSAQMLNQSAFVQGNFLMLSTWRLLKGKKTKKNKHIPSQRLAFVGDICKVNGLFTVFPCLLLLSVL